MSAILDGTATEDEQVRLAELNAKSDDLRAELQMLEFAGERDEENCALKKRDL